jgi:N-methylhydantoinase B
MDPVRTEVMKNRFAAIVEEASTIAYRTAHTTFVKQTQDYQVALATPEGEIFAFPYMAGVTTFIGISLKATLDYVGIDNIAPGDVIITNDPFISDGMCSHTMDIHLIHPVFHGEELLAFGWAFIHASDIGGAVPGSISPTLTEIYQEGIRMRPVKLYKAGALNRELLDLFQDNCRIPDEVWGDLKAMISALRSMDHRLVELCDKFGDDDIKAGMREVMDLAETKARSVIAGIPDGCYRFSDYLEGVVPGETIFINTTMTVVGDEVMLDFAGSDPQVPAALNFITGARTHPFLCLALSYYILTMEPGTPMNAGLNRPITTRAPKGTIMNAEFPAAMGNRWVTVMRIYDTVVACLNQALPGGIVTAGAGQAGIIAVQARDPITGKKRVSVIDPLCGGSGGRRNGDGVDGVDGPFGFLRSTPTETVEVETPILIRRFALAADSQGAGYHRSGAAIVMEMENRDLEVAMTCRGMDRFQFRPWGFEGGAAGESGSVVVNPGRPDERDIGKITVLELKHRDLVRITTPSGGGFGDPLKREPERVLTDVRSDLLSTAKALADYGVVIRDGAVDVAATEAERARRRAARNRLETFSFGAERQATDEIWPPDVRAALATALLEEDAVARPHLLKAVRDRMKARGRTVDPATMRAAIAAELAVLRDEPEPEPLKAASD